MYGTVAPNPHGGFVSAQLKGPRKLLRIRPGIFDFDSDFGRKRGQTKPKIHGTVPTDRDTTTANDSGPISSCFDDPKLLHCEIAQTNYTWVFNTWVL